MVNSFDFLGERDSGLRRAQRTLAMKTVVAPYRAEPGDPDDYLLML